MLIQITNKCHMNCPHCMQDSLPEGKNMSEEIFREVLKICHASYPRVINMSGGEPLEHPEWQEIAWSLLSVRSALVVCILTNGSWIEDGRKRHLVARLIRENKGRLKVQVYSHPDYYKQHDWTVEHEKQFRSLGCITDFHSPIYMQDLGRAKKNCVKEVEASNFVPSCINSHLIAKQSGSLIQFNDMCMQVGKVCRPLIDVDGYIHMSESWLCPSVAHVSDGPAEIFRKMKASKPCKGCRLYKNFQELHPNELKLIE